jgi:lipopolysaccharide export system protein LptC
MTDTIGAAPRRRIRYDPRRTGGEDAYQAARRHSRLVRALKFVLPGLAIAGVLLFWASAHFIPSDLASLISVAGIDAKSNSVVMDKPHISGFEGTRRAYEVKAESARQSLDDPKVLTFTAIDAHIGLDDASTATVGAATGIYNGNNNTLQLKDGIVIETTSGYSASIESAAVDLGKGSLVSDRPIELRSKDGTLRANAVEVSERGKHVVFKGGVSVTYMPPAELAQAPEPQ